MNAKCSVLMSVYANDDAGYLAQALQSVYEGQSKKPDELVVVLDGPLPDDVRETLESFKLGKGDRVKFVALAENKGLGEALRIGSEQCSGDYIFRMDADDVSHPLRFEKQLLFMEDHPEVDVVGADIAEFLEDVNEEGKRVRQCPSCHEDIVRMGKRRNPMNHVSVCMKREALLACGGYKELLLLEDYYLWLRMIGAGLKLANINEPLVYVRIGNGLEEKRGSKERIVGWKTLQDYMRSIGMVSRSEAAANMLYINFFVRSPAFLKRLFYSAFLRK